MATTDVFRDFLHGLNDGQRQAVQHGATPLLVVAGAGTGKTRTVVHRVTHLIQQGTDPSRILLLTFTRRAATEMLRRVGKLMREARLPGADSRRIWGGTFHSIGARLLRLHGHSIGLEAAFSIIDRSDAEDLMDLIRTELDLAATDRRFPKKRTCLSIYSNCVNSQRPIEEVLETDFPWCEEVAEELKKLFKQYVDRKERSGVLDYDDLLLFWQGLLSNPAACRRIQQSFDCVLVDEYQDTNWLQADILQRLSPDGEGLTVVGDDAQSIYSFRAATVRNILEFPSIFPGTTVVRLQQNYRSTQPILQATNQVIAEAKEGYAKTLWSERQGGAKPTLLVCMDEDEQTEYVVDKILQHREEGLLLREQAVLFRASYHSMALEAELARRNIPFVKYGGLKFLEAAHVKDFLAFLRLAENPRDEISGSRVLMLLPGVGPKRAAELMTSLHREQGDFSVWKRASYSAAVQPQLDKLAQLMRQLSAVPLPDLSSQARLVRQFYEPVLWDRFDNAEPRRRDLEQLELIVSRYADRPTLLAEMTLDPPVSSEDLPGPAKLDEDYLILSTIHSAKGLEWKSVYVMHASDGNIPSDMATTTPEQIEEERRLFYVALTRAQDWLYVCCPQRYYHLRRGPRADRYGLAQVTRFISNEVGRYFERATPAAQGGDSIFPARDPQGHTNIRENIKSLWR